MSHFKIPTGLPCIVQFSGAAQAHLDSGWRDISTAPRDGRMLLWFPCYKFAQIGWWNNADQQFEEMFKMTGEPYIAPTHWMPLPQRPEGEK